MREDQNEHNYWRGTIDVKIETMAKQMEEVHELLVKNGLVKMVTENNTSILWLRGFIFTLLLIIFYVVV